jgi:tRNA nucleotidyltransferase (CCA-adding enzyme)
MSIGKDYIQNITKEEKDIFLSILCTLSAIDGKSSEAEIEFIEEIAKDIKFKLKPSHFCIDENFCVYKASNITNRRLSLEIAKYMLALSYTDNSFSDKEGHYTGLKILQKTGVLGYILPELTLGENMPQRKDFHAYDVLEHTLKTVLYADKSIRLPALFHDIGKPYAYKMHGKFASHSLDGEIIARETLNRLKAPVKIIEEVCLLTALHMVDFDLKMKRNKVSKRICFTSKIC